MSLPNGGLNGYSFKATVSPSPNEECWALGKHWSERGQGARRRKGRSSAFCLTSIVSSLQSHYNKSPFNDSINVSNSAFLAS